MKPAMKIATWIVLGVLMSAVPAAAEMWRYTDETGAINFTNDYSNIPLKLRGSAKKHVLKTDDEIAEARHQYLDALTSEMAKQQLAQGELTEEDVQYLVTKGSLRTSELGDAYRFSKSRNQIQSERLAAQAAAATAATQADGSLSIQQMQAMSGGQVGELKKFAKRIQESPNFKNSLYFEGVLMALMIVGLPFVLRNYHDDGTRRIIRASFFFSFLIISATGNILLFKDEITDVMNLGASLQANPSVDKTVAP